MANINFELIMDSINGALGTELPIDFIPTMGREALVMEMQFNEKAGFTVADDELPAFFYDEKLQPTNKSARHHAQAVNDYRLEWLSKHNVTVNALPGDSPY